VVKGMKVSTVFYTGQYFEYFNFGVFCKDLDTLYTNLKDLLEKDTIYAKLYKAQFEGFM